MAKRDDVVPENFLHHLQAEILGFSDEKLEDQCKLAHMIWLGRLKRRQHRAFAGAVSFHHAELTEAFGRGKFKVINERLGLFKVSSNWDAGLAPGSRSTHTKAYWFSRAVKDARRSYLCRSVSAGTRLLMMTGDVMKSLPKAVASNDMLGVTTTAWTHAVGIGRVPVDQSMLRQLSLWLVGFRDHPIRRQDWRRGAGLSEATDFPSQVLLERLIDATAQVLEMSQTDVAGPGVLPHRYEQAQSGRLYAKGINLQSSPTLIKQAALVGRWEYDFSNCHYSILTQMAARYDYTCIAIAQYLANKGETRQAIATQARITKTDAKTCLLAILYGARATDWSENAIPEEIGVEAARRLYAVPLFMGIKTDVANARKAILAGFTRNKNGSLTNAFGNAIDGKAKATKQLAHLIQGVEAKALHVAVTLHPSEIQLVQHDGFVSGVRLDSVAISDAVFEATGYRLELEEARVWIDFDAQLLKDRFQLENPLKPSIGAGSKGSLVC